MTGGERARLATDRARTWGIRVRSRREALGLSQSQVASLAGVSPQTISKVEYDDILPRPRTMEAIARALGSSCEGLFPHSARPAEPAPPHERNRPGRPREQVA